MPTFTSREELLDRRHRHADAAVRGGGAERREVGRAVDALAVVEAHVARLERVLRIAGRDRPAGEVARPVAVRARATPG